MSAQLQPEPRSLLPMREADLDAVLAIEHACYEFPWTRGNFIDSLHAGCTMQVLATPRGTLVGYFVAMNGVAEMHLLNLCVAPAEQGHGHARYMLDALQRVAHGLQAQSLWLEVRMSNTRARALYERYGFVQAGMRRGYYPAQGRTREDAAVMSLALEPRHAMG